MPRPWKGGQVRASSVRRGEVCARTCPPFHRRWDNRFAIAPIAPNPDDGEFEFSFERSMPKRYREQQRRAEPRSRLWSVDHARWIFAVQAADDAHDETKVRPGLGESPQAKRRGGQLGDAITDEEGVALAERRRVGLCEGVLDRFSAPQVVGVFMGRFHGRARDEGCAGSWSGASARRAWSRGPPPRAGRRSARRCALRCAARRVGGW